MEAEDVDATKVRLSTRVTSAQKLEMDRATVFPLNPSEGFPMSPTLWVNTQPLTFEPAGGEAGSRRGYLA